MQGDIFVIISTIFCLLCYLSDYISLYNTIYTIGVLEKLQENKQVNLFSLRIRSCIFIANGSYLYYIILNNIQDSIISFSIYLSLDTILLITRSTCAIVLYKKQKQQKIFLMNQVENPMTTNNIV